MKNRKHDRHSLAPEGAILCVSMLVVLVIGVISYIDAERMKSTLEQLRISRGIVEHNLALLSALKDAESGQRGFLVTGQQEFLQPYHQSLTSIPELLNRLQLLTDASPDQRARLRAIQPLVAAKLQELEETIQLRRANRGAEAIAIVNAGRGKAIMDEIRWRSYAINQVADRRLARFAVLADETSARLRIVSTLGSTLLLGFLIVSAITILRGLNRREELYEQCYTGERKLAITLSSIADGVISTDFEARIVLINPVAERLVGWTEQACLGLHISEVFRIVNESTRNAVENPLERAIAEGSAVSLANHTILIARDGKETFIDDSAAPIRNDGGEVVGAVLVFRDISERRHSERRQAEAALALQRSNEELQQFAFAASHDLRSPLNSVNVVAQLLASRFGDKLGLDGSEMIDYITGGVSRMMRMVEDLLTLAKTSDINRETAGAASMIEPFNTACRNLRTEVEATGAVISASPLPVVAARDTHIVQLFQNILNNALKYRGPSPPRIHVSAVRKDSEWIIGITDNGMGIDPQYTEQIFQPFKRLHGQAYEGNGIGLSTCKKIVLGYGGQIWVESEVGKGSTFFFSLPAAETQGAMAESAGG